MRRALVGMLVIGIGILLAARPAVSQQGDKKHGKEPKKGLHRFELGIVLPPPLMEQLDLTPQQRREIDDLQRQVKDKLERILTDDQKEAVRNFRPPMSPDQRQPKKDGPPSESSPAPRQKLDGPRLNLKGGLRAADKSPFTIAGDAKLIAFGDPSQELAGSGVSLFSADDLDKNGEIAGSVSCTVTGLPAKQRWYRVLVRGLAQEKFAAGDLFIRVDFFKDAGKNSLDHVTKSILPQVERDRQNLADAGTNKNLGPSTWRTYSIDIRTPFPEVDTLGVAVGFNKGKGGDSRSEFRVAEIEVTPISNPSDYTPPTAEARKPPPALESLVKLGGRWYYDPRGGDRTLPTQFDAANADRLYYLSDRLETPFANNMTSSLRRGYRDVEGNTIDEDRPVDDSLTVTFTDKFLVMKSKNLPNHPTGVFPDRTRFLDGNPGIIGEQRHTWRIPLEPTPNPERVAMTAENKRALPMGPIGVMCNGVVFYNPFDHIAEADAVWRLDRCCGHPSPDTVYHYHKYPVCINTPWADDGEAHSPLIGFAFDGYPVYGPYESAGVLAKDATRNPLNEFNLHDDPVRGPHYHVTPGKFPHIIGGYWGVAEASNRGAKKGPPKK